MLRRLGRTCCSSELLHVPSRTQPLVLKSTHFPTDGGADLILILPVCSQLSSLSATLEIHCWLLFEIMAMAADDIRLSLHLRPTLDSTYFTLSDPSLPLFHLLSWTLGNMLKHPEHCKTSFLIVQGHTDCAQGPTRKLKLFGLCMLAKTTKTVLDVVSSKRQKRKQVLSRSI